MTLPSIRATVSKLRNSLTPATSLFCAGVFAMGTLSRTPALATSSAEALHLWAETLELNNGVYFGDKIQIFGQEYRLLAERLRWEPSIQKLEAWGQVNLSHPTWDLQASSLRWHLTPGYLEAERLVLDYRQLQLNAAQAQLQATLWQFQEVQISGLLPWPVQAQYVRLQPQATPPQLLLEEIKIPGLAWRWPQLTVNLNQTATDRLEVRPPFSVLQPDVGWGEGGLQGGVRSQLWQDSQQRLYGWSLYHPQMGWRNALAYEWRPEGQVLNLELGLHDTWLQGNFQHDWRSPWGLWLRSSAQWQSQDAFWSGFWLPELQGNLQRNSSLSFWLASEPQQWEAISYRYLAGARWPQQELGLSLSAEMPLIQWSPEHQLWSSGYLNLLYSRQGYPTAGLRLSERWLPTALPLEAGVYGESYISGLPAEIFLHPQRLQPWLGAYAIWQLSPQWGLAAETAISLNNLEPARADLMLSWKLAPLYLHALLRGIPAGLQFQVRFELD